MRQMKTGGGVERKDLGDRRKEKLPLAFKINTFI